MNPILMRAYTYVPRKLMFALLFILTCAFAQAQNGDCTGFHTQTQGGWGADPRGNNPGVYLQNNFSAAFPSGLTIGCANGNKLVLTSATAVNAFLPSGSTPSLLPAGTLTDPGATYSNVFAGQLVTAVLNVGFDYYDPNFSSNSINTGDLIITTGTFAGWTINQLISEANNTIGGCSSNYSASDLNDALTSFNENYDNGTTDNGYTSCQTRCTIEVSGKETDVTCHGSSNGAIDITVSGANGSVSYLWSDGSTSEDRTGLAPGNYNVTVTDSKNCKATASFTVSEPDALGVTAVTADITTVGGNDGSIDLTVTGGTKPYSYSWSDGYTGEDRTGLTAGDYSVVITDANGCSTKASYTLKGPDCQVAVKGITTDVKCYGDSNGSIDITVSGAIGDVTYLWNDGYTGEDRSNLAAGNYSVTVKDAAGCSASASFTVSQPSKPLKIRSQVTGVSGPKKCDGTAQVKAVGGTAPYTYQWHDGYVGDTRTGLCKGTYIVTVTDAHGCSVCCQVKIECASTTGLASTISSTTLKGNSNADVAPNPTNGLINLTVNARTSGTAIVNVYDMSGKKLSTQSFSVGAGANYKKLDLSKYTQGLYNVEVITGNEKKITKVAVEK